MGENKIAIRLLSSQWLRVSEEVWIPLTSTMHCLGQLLSTAVDLLTASDLGGFMPFRELLRYLEWKKICEPTWILCGQKVKQLIFKHLFIRKQTF